MKARTAALLVASATLPVAAAAYPLDGYEATGIRRLLAIRLAQEGKLAGGKQPAGALLNLADVDLRLLGRDLVVPAPDPQFTRKIVDILGADAEDYGLAVLDLSDPASPRYAEHRGEHRQNVGSVGKLVVALSQLELGGRDGDARGHAPAPVREELPGARGGDPGVLQGHFFKSGSLYQCKPEPGFRCAPYAGNSKNFMNSVAIVEHPAGGRRLHYMVTIVSNVLRRNSASVHMELATRLQRLLESLHPAPAPAPPALSTPGGSR